MRFDGIINYWSSPKWLKGASPVHSSDDSPLATGQATVPSSLSLTLWMFEVNFGECGTPVNLCQMQLLISSLSELS